METQKKRPAIEGDTSVFPCDIVQNILSRLPVKSLLRFRTVCKPWKVAIKDSGFAKIHFNQLNTSKSRCFLLTGSSFDGAYSLIQSQGQEFKVQSVVQFPSKEFESANLLCCCEGIVVFKGSSCQKYLLLNPFTRNYSSFSCPFHDIVHGSDSLSHGLCFDKYEDDYKLVIVVSEGCKYLVYSFKEGSWTERQSEFRGYVNLRGTYADGSLHWILFLPGRRYSIIYFDPKDNMLKKLHDPGDSSHERKFVLLENYRGNLCFYTCDAKDMVVMWLLKESGGSKCWLKLGDKRPKSPASDPILVPHTPIYMTSQNEVVYHERLGTKYVVCCPQEQKIVGVEEFPACSKMIGLTCLESLNFPATPRDL